MWAHATGMSSCIRSFTSAKRHVSGRKGICLLAVYWPLHEWHSFCFEDAFATGTLRSRCFPCHSNGSWLKGHADLEAESEPLKTELKHSQLKACRMARRMARRTAFGAAHV